MSRRLPILPATGPGVYMIYCHENEKAYIGSSKHVSQRFNHHRYHLRSNKHGNQHLQNAWNLYGEDSFSFGVIQPCPDGDHLRMEQYYLDVWFETGMVFNRHTDVKSPSGRKWTSAERSAKSAAMKAAPPFKGRTHTAESRELLSRAHKAWMAVNPNPFAGKTHTEETKAAISAANKGHTRSRGRRLSDRAKRLISAANTGRHVSPETRAKISAATKGSNNPRFGKRVTQEQKDKTAATLAMRTQEEIDAFRAKMSAVIKALPPKTPEQKEAFNSKRNATRSAKRAAMTPEELEARRRSHAEALRATRARNNAAMSAEEREAKRARKISKMKATLAKRTPEEWSRITEKRLKSLAI